MQKPKLIAECAKLHYGNMERAKEMISLCANHGVNAVKFQSYDIKDINKDHNNYSKDCRAHLTVQELYELSMYAKAKNLDFYCSAFSLSVLEPLSAFTEIIKIPSTFFGKEEFVGEATKHFNELHLSTGFHSFEDTNWLMDKYKKLYPRHKLIFYHCVSEYPNTRYNMQRIKKLNMQGYSHHSAEIWPMILAWIIGAKQLEFHVMTNVQDSKLWCVRYQDINDMLRKMEDILYYYTDKDNSEIEKTNFEFFKTEFKDLIT
jgi:N,N'-diacetyllegionaminate synthase